MRLINTKTLQLEEFMGGTPTYAILSHTWGKNEVLLQEWVDWQSGKDQAIIEAKEGHKKILAFCNLARRYNHEYVWVDTNCIDKASSAELSEAINAMFDWYQGAATCYVYLADFDGVKGSEMGGCRWFTRGWTLQELIAPRKTVFYNKSWQLIGTSTQLASYISEFTGIDKEILFDPSGIYNACTAKRLSWASQRETTRIEDRAYSLLGILHINMPLLYGEGERAFQRLQEEIMKVSTDHSLFAWDWPQEWSIDMTPTPNWVSVLAPNLSAFRNCGNIVQVLAGQDLQDKIYTMTNLGLSISLPIVSTVSPHHAVAVLQCCYKDDEFSDRRLCITLGRSRDGFMRLPFPPCTLYLTREAALDTEATARLHFPRFREWQPDEVVRRDIVNPPRGGEWTLIFLEMPGGLGGWRARRLWQGDFLRAEMGDPSDSPWLSIITAQSNTVEGCVMTFSPDSQDSQSLSLVILGMKTAHGQQLHIQLHTTSHEASGPMSSGPKKAPGLASKAEEDHDAKLLAKEKERAFESGLSGWSWSASASGLHLKMGTPTMAGPGQTIVPVYCSSTPRRTQHPNALRWEESDDSLRRRRRTESTDAEMSYAATPPYTATPSELWYDIGGSAEPSQG
jgi:hypothetical protein